MNGNPFLETVNGFDFMLIGFIAVLAYLMYINAVSADNWEATAKHKDKALRASYQHVDDLVYSNNKLFVQCGDAREELRQVETERDLMAKYLDKKCYCSKAHSQIRCLFHDFVEQERRNQIDPWSAPPQTTSPWCDGKNLENCDLTCDNPLQHEVILKEWNTL